MTLMLKDQATMDVAGAVESLASALQSVEFLGDFEAVEITIGGRCQATMRLRELRALVRAHTESLESRVRFHAALATYAPYAGKQAATFAAKDLTYSDLRDLAPLTAPVVAGRVTSACAYYPARDARESDLLVAVVEVLSCLGKREGYFGSIGAPKTMKLIEAAEAYDTVIPYGRGAGVGDYRGTTGLILKGERDARPA